MSCSYYRLARPSYANARQACRAVCTKCYGISYGIFKQYFDARFLRARVCVMLASSYFVEAIMELNVMPALELCLLLTGDEQPHR